MIHWRSAAFWIGFAVLLPQALWVRRRATRFADAGGDRQGRIDGPGPLRLLAIGDSIIAGVGCATLQRACPGQTADQLARALGRGLSWQALGQTGATTGQILTRLVPRLPDQPADFILVSAGVNDITGLETLSHWDAALSALIDALHAHSPGARIALLGIPPMHCFPRLPQPLRALFGLRARSFDALAHRRLSGIGHAVYVRFDGEFRADQFAPDGYHPSEDSCREIGQAIASAFCSLDPP